MRLAKLSFLVLASWALTAVAGCETRSMPRDTGGRDVPGLMLMDTGPRTPDVPVISMPDVPPPPRDVPAPRDVPVGRDSGGRLCASITCTSNADCASMCPPNPMGANCCDTAVGRCYAATMPACPAPGTDSGMSMY